MTAMKQDIAFAIDRLGIKDNQRIPVGDDAAAIPRDGGFDLLACEGMDGQFVRAMPWFAGWSSVMVNLSDIAAMGGTPTALVNAVWASDRDGDASEVFDGMRAACDAFEVPMVGGHTNLQSTDTHLAVAVMGHAVTLLTSFDAMPEQALVMAVDLHGRWHGNHPFWDAATDASPKRLRQNLRILPRIAAEGLAVSAKDISQAGILGTATMLCETSRVGVSIDGDRIPRPLDVDFDRWLKVFPSFGFLLATDPESVGELVELFHSHDVAASRIGTFDDSQQVTLHHGGTTSLFHDLTTDSFTGC
ncbi:MAG: sll0787 family AIR synthase-like protein [Planctomycetota bacterium]